MSTDGSRTRNGKKALNLQADRIPGGAARNSCHLTILNGPRARPCRHGTLGETCIMCPDERTSANGRRRGGLGGPTPLLGRPWLRALGRRRALWNALAVVLLSLVVLLGLQYRVLVDLQRSTAVAHAVALEDRLDGIVNHVARHVSATTAN